MGSLRQKSFLGGLKKIALNQWALTILLLFLTSSSFAGVIPCKMINLQGSYKLKIDDGIFADFSEYAVQYFENDYVRFSELMDTDTKIIQFYPKSFSEQEEVRETEVKTNVIHQDVQTMKASIESGKRGNYCSLEVTGTKIVDQQVIPFSEYYLVLALSYQGEYFFWLGHPNEGEKKVAYYRLTKLNTSSVAFNR